VEKHIRFIGAEWGVLRGVSVIVFDAIDNKISNISELTLCGLYPTIATAC
jgi:hypothetical protein